MRERWRWLVLPFCALALVMGVRGAVGVYLVPWQTEFGSGRAQVASVSSLSLLVYGLGNVLAGPAAERFGVTRVVATSLGLVAAGLVGSALSGGLGSLYLFYGLVASAGFAGASHVTASVAVRRHFPEARRNLALSVVVTGMAAGQMFVVPAQVLAVATWGWRPVLAALAAAAALLGAAAAVRAGPEAAEPPNGPRRAPGTGGARGLLQDPMFWAFLAPYAVCGFTDSGLVDNHFVPYARGAGVPEAQLAAALSLLAVANLAGTLGAGYLADRWGRGTVLAGLYAVRALALGLLVAGGSEALWGFSLLFGATHFATIAPTNNLALTLFQGSAPALAVGLASFVHQLGAAAGAFAGGVAYDRLGGYGPAFFLSAVLLVASAGTMGWIHRVEARSAAQPRWMPRRT